MFEPAGVAGMETPQRRPIDCNCSRGTPSKAEFSKLKHELEDRDEEVHTLRDELAEKEKQMLQMQEKCQALLKEALDARDLRDELDCIKQQQSDFDKVRKENKALKDLLTDFEYFKTRSVSLKTENETLEDTITEMEGQLSDLKEDLKRKAECDSRVTEMEVSVQKLHVEISQKNGNIEMLITEKKQLETEIVRLNERLNMERTPRNEGTSILENLASEMMEIEKQEVTEIRLELQRLKMGPLRTDSEQQTISCPLISRSTSTANISSEDHSTMTTIETKDQACSCECEIPSTSYAEDMELLQKQVNAESAKLLGLREELLNERLRCSDIRSQLILLHSKISTAKVDFTNIELKELMDVVCKAVLDAMCSARSEADKYRYEQAKQIAELGVLTKDIEQLRQTDNAALLESDKRLQQLLKENFNVREQVFLLQDQVRKAELDSNTKDNELCYAKEECDRLKKADTENARKIEDLRLQITKTDSRRMETVHELESLSHMHQELLENYDRLQSVYDMLTDDYESLKMNASRDAQLLERERSVTRSTIPLEEQFAMQHTIESLKQLNASYEEQVRNLQRQTELLLQQNKELLNRALDDKDYHVQEQRAFQERLGSLRRHKEKLEEKIMDQYRSIESRRSDRSKQHLVKRAAKALLSIKRSPNSSQPMSPVTDTPTPSSSDEYMNSNDNTILTPIHSPTRTATIRHSMRDPYRSPHYYSTPTVRNNSSSMASRLLMPNEERVHDDGVWYEYGCV